MEAVQTAIKGVWESAQAYEPYLGRWRRQIAARFIDWLAPPHRARGIDVGTGTGAIVEAILQRADPGSILALDRSEGYLAYARAHQPDPRVAFRLGDAARLPAGADAFDVATSGLMLNFVPDAAAIVAEMARVTRSGRPRDAAAIVCANAVITRRARSASPRVVRGNERVMPGWRGRGHWDFSAS